MSVPLTETEQLYIKRLKSDIRTGRILKAAILLTFAGFIFSQVILLPLATRNSNYLQKLVCASGIVQGCPKPDAKSIELQKQLAAQSAKRDAGLLNKIQALLDRKAETKVVEVAGPTNTRTIIITRTRTVTICRLPNGRPC